MEYFYIVYIYIYNNYNNSDVQGSAKSLDSLETSHPIENEVHSPDEIKEIFDSISYDKGGSVLRMIYCYLGHDVFRKVYINNNNIYIGYYIIFK